MRENIPTHKKPGERLSARHVNTVSRVAHRFARMAVSNVSSYIHTGAQVGIVAHAPWRQTVVTVTSLKTDSQDGEYNGLYLCKPRFHNPSGSYWDTDNSAEWVLDARDVGFKLRVGDRLVAWWDRQRGAFVPCESRGLTQLARVTEVTGPREGKIRLLNWNIQTGGYDLEEWTWDAVAAELGMPPVGTTVLVQPLKPMEGFDSMRWEVLAYASEPACFFARIELDGYTTEPPIRCRYSFVEVEMQNGSWVNRSGGRQGVAYNGLEEVGIYHANYTLAPIDNGVVVLVWIVRDEDSEYYWFCAANRIKIPANRWGGEVFTLDPNGAPYLNGTTLVIPRRDLDFDEGFLVGEAQAQAAQVDLMSIAVPEGGLTGTYGPFLYNAPYVQNGKLYFPTANITYQRGCVTAITAGQTIEVELP